VIWSSDGGDIVTTNPSGVRDEIWFSGNQLVHKNPDGGIDGLEGQSFAPIRDLQDDRSFLTWTTPPAWMGMLGPHEGVTVDGEFGPGIAIRWKAIPFRERSGIGALWSAWGGAFASDGPPRVAASFPVAPRSSWRFPTSTHELDASVGGHPARVVLATGEGGLRVSKAFARGRGEQLGSWQSMFFIQAPARPYARITRVLLAGASVGSTIAEVTDDDRSDLYAGIDIFRGQAIELARGRPARTTQRRCRQDEGVEAQTYRGRVVLPELDRAAMRQPPIVFPRGEELRGALGPVVFRTLLDTAYHGPPTFFPGGPMRMRFASFGGVDGAVRIGTCDVRGSVMLTMVGKRFGRGHPRCEDDQVHGRWAPDPGVDALIGLDSLDAKTLLVDLQNNRVCWYN
jgi:hypothetical protein